MVLRAPTIASVAESTRRLRAADPTRCCVRTSTSWWSPPPRGWSAGSPRPRAPGPTRRRAAAAAAGPGWWREARRRAPRWRRSASSRTGWGRPRPPRRSPTSCWPRAWPERASCWSTRAVATRPVRWRCVGPAPGSRRSRPTAGSPSTTGPRSGPRWREVGQGRFDAVLFTSAPGAHAWLRAVRRAELLDVVRDRIDSRQLLLGAVGPVTAEPLAFAGLLARVPATSRLADLVRLVIEDLGDDRHALHDRSRPAAAAGRHHHAGPPGRRRCRPAAWRCCGGWPRPRVTS